MADEQFHQANNTWDVTKNQEKEGGKKKEKKTHTERSLGNNQVEDWLVA